MDKEIDELGKPIDKTYLECNLPKFLVKSIKALEESWEILDRGERDGKLINADCNGALNILKKSKVVDLEVLYCRGELNTPVRIRVA